MVSLHHRAPLVLLGVLGLAATRAHAEDGAQSGDKAAAESFFHAARELMDAGRYGEACPKLAESQRLDPTLGTLLNLARCHQLQGKTATAWAEYREVALLAEREGQPDRAEVARGLAAELEPALSSVRITVAAAPPPGMTIERNGVVMSDASIGTDFPVDPGVQSIRASAPGHHPWTTEVEVKPGGDRQTIVIPPLDALPPPPPPPPLAPVFGVGALPPAPVVEQPAREPIDWSTVGFVVGGVGLASIAVGGIFGAIAATEVSDAEDDGAKCPGKVCTDEGFEQVEAAETKAWVANITIGLGLLAVAGGGLMLALDPGDAASSGTASKPMRGAVAWRGAW